jgi:hypothetical protein
MLLMATLLGSRTEGNSILLLFFEFKGITQNVFNMPDRNFLLLVNDTVI